MTSIKLKFRPSKDYKKEGTLYIQLIHARKVKRIKCNYRVYNEEWDYKHNQIKHLIPSKCRQETVGAIRANLQWEINKIKGIINHYNETEQSYTVDDILSCYKKTPTTQYGVFEFIRTQIIRLKRLGRIRTSEIYQSTLNSFMKFRNNIDVDFTSIDSDMIELYEANMKKRGLSRNTTAFYMRTLRTNYNLAVTQNLTTDNRPFSHVYCGMDKTVKRAISLNDIKRIKDLDLIKHPALDFARNMFLLSFCMRGMSFIDMAYLRKRDLDNGLLIYRRKKTGQTLSIEWTEQMQKILEKYRPNPTQYLLPIITEQNVDERRQYQNQILRVNRHLKSIATMLGIAAPLSMYYSRHSWASIARSKEVSISVISSALGHKSVETTQIYLDSISQSEIDKANRMILLNL